jgi:hypothetical protein
MENRRFSEALVLGAFVCLGLALLGFQIYRGVTAVKALDRTVTVKGLAEREVPADAAIWPVKFNEVANGLGEIFSIIGDRNALVVAFLKENGFTDGEITVSVPAVTDRQALGYADAAKLPHRYAGSSVVTVYTVHVEKVRGAMNRVAELGKRGVAIVGEDYGVRPEFLFTRLNDVKPSMIEDATRNAREVAEKFAKDSGSRLGKIKTANQGQFSISDRDSNTPYIKNVRVVSTIEYYLSD